MGCELGAATCQLGATALMVAADKGRSPVVELLLSSGADKETRDFVCYGIGGCVAVRNVTDSAMVDMGWLDAVWCGVVRCTCMYAG